MLKLNLNQNQQRWELLSSYQHHGKNPIRLRLNHFLFKSPIDTLSQPVTRPHVKHFLIVFAHQTAAFSPQHSDLTTSSTLVPRYCVRVVPAKHNNNKY
ncbi:hypothetical protein Zmor_022799 [Zophobas morio]|uniref:Uncharacterized protein n=1 Tax=Zophobas morio TaxID=2755281 RepID=A0AA38M732_9CUCU|nr:hypothetical protein Zmor_022799 [Zophobas morio]